MGNVGEMSPWLRVLAAVLAYCVVALLASAATRRIGVKLERMQSRIAAPVLLIGVVANWYRALVTAALVAMLFGLYGASVNLA